MGASHTPYFLKLVIGTALNVAEERILFPPVLCARGFLKRHRYASGCHFSLKNSCCILWAGARVSPVVSSEISMVKAQIA